MNALSLAARFALPGRVVAVEPWGKGLINATFRVRTACALGIMQRLNRSVFPEPARVMANLRQLQDYWQNLPDPPGLRLPRLIPTRVGEDFLEDAHGECWRMLEYLDGVTLAKVETPKVAEALGGSLGLFHRLLAGTSSWAWREALPGFHRTGKYLAALERARRRQKAQSGLLGLFCWIEGQSAWALCLEQARQKGLLPLRVVHGDPKLDNLLFDPKTLLPLAWLDLDTVGPGLIHYDIGDCLRSVCHQAGGFELDLVEPVLEGWWREVKTLLTAAEIHLVPEAIALLPFELGVRFLTDYLEGNRYFKVREAEENLHRALEQFALARAAYRQRRRLTLLWRKLTLKL